MVLTLPTYDPPMVVSDVVPGGMQHPAGKGLLQFALRILTRKDEVVVDFGEFKDLISWRDSLSVESASGTFSFRMRAILCNEELLRRVHPGLVIEAYAARNDNAIQGVVRDPHTLYGDYVDSTPAEVDPSNPDPPDPDPTKIPIAEDAYLDKAPYLLLRGIITDYGRTADGNETLLYVSGESYGKIYKDAYVLTDLRAPEAQGVNYKSLEMRQATAAGVGTLTVLYYRLLRDWVEHFWGEETGWIARTRPIPGIRNFKARINTEGSVWSALQYLACEGIFHQFVDHTGAIVWEKLPYSSQESSLIPGRDWEDLPMIDCPSWKILTWNDRLSEQGVCNYLRMIPIQSAISGGVEQAAEAAFIYNVGSIKQYGGPNKKEIQVPVAIIDKDNWYTAPDRRIEQGENNWILDQMAIEAIRWYDRPVQRVGVTVRGEAAWRIHTRVSLVESWHCPDAKPAEYYVISRTHQIDIQRGSWITSMEMLRDRRQRYLGIGQGEDFEFPVAAPVDAASFPPNASLGLGDRVQFSSQYDFEFPDLSGDFGVRTLNELHLEADDYWMFNRFSGQVEHIGGDPIAWMEQHTADYTAGRAGTIGTPTAGRADGVEQQPDGTIVPVDPNAPAPAQPVQFEPVTRIYRDNLIDESPPGSYDFSLERDGNVITSIPSPVNGRVTRSEVISGYGNVVEVTSDDGYVWFMAHMDRSDVAVGQQVVRGQNLGNQGFTGRVFPANENGSHVHLEISHPQHGAGNPYDRVTNRSITQPMVEEYLAFVQHGGG